MRWRNHVKEMGWRNEICLHVEDITKEELRAVLRELGCRVYSSHRRSKYFSQIFDVKCPFYEGQDYPRAHLEIVTTEDAPNRWTFFGHIDALPHGHRPVSQENTEKLKREYPDKDNRLENDPARKVEEIFIDAFRNRGYRCGGLP